MAKQRTESQKAYDATAMALIRLRRILDDRNAEILEFSVIIRDLEVVLDHLDAQ